MKKYFAVFIFVFFILFVNESFADKKVEEFIELGDKNFENRQYDLALNNYKNALKKLGIILLISIPTGSWYILDKIYKTVDVNNLSLGSLFRTATQANAAHSWELDYQRMFEQLTNFNYLHSRIIDMLWSNLGWHVIHTPPQLTLIANAGLVLVLVL